MSLLRPSISGRLLRAGGSASQRGLSGAVRFNSQDAQSKELQTATPTSMTEGVQLRHNQQNYFAEVDQATSQFSPVPKRVMDGSHEGTVLAAAVLSGAPIELETRTVRIYKPTKPATQSGDWHGHHWRMDWDTLPKGHRWENPLMGWQSSADFMQGTNVNFKTKEEAIRFAEKQGYEYYVQEPQSRKITPKLYANNFLWSDKKLKHIRTK
ncbi:hypothetical protein HYALB_00012701 [Hymenoscyphus albidus]|uniref:NADH dehydrogenase [ubiquinone] iron-sulfur protein 4, mitochondrial n=1 Tax=Hymenoscyphus albidus TaxID=595503 RepID=A0A9N9Q8H4_9HELO|nr:hypothetical protein HYALB_00012701 [Hymenoscyphus albidus]